MAHYLVVAHQTADSEELVEAVRELAEHGDSTFALLVPATPVDHLATWTEGEAQAAAVAQANLAEGRLRAVVARSYRRRSETQALCWPCRTHYWPASTTRSWCRLSRSGHRDGCG